MEDKAHVSPAWLKAGHAHTLLLATSLSLPSTQGINTVSTRYFRIKDSALAPEKCKTDCEAEQSAATQANWVLVLLPVT